MAVLTVVAVGKVAVGRLLGCDVGIVLDDVPVAVAACITFGDVALACLDVDIGCLDCI